MPTYDYFCPVCEVLSETTVPVADRDNVYCPVCEELVRRQVAAPGFTLRGPGFTPKSGRGRSE